MASPTKTYTTNCSIFCSVTLSDVTNQKGVFSELSDMLKFFEKLFAEMSDFLIGKKT